MFNPFAEDDDRSPADAELVERAKSGDHGALETLVLRHQAWTYNIAVRMVFHPQDAEEVTQEVLVKVITKLSTFKGESKFRTWLYRVAANHVLNMKRRSAETKVTTFADYGAAIDRTPDLDLPDRKSVPVELPVLVEEAKNGCTMGMLLCLDRKQRLIFTLGEILGVSDAVGAEVLEMTSENFRQCLARARRDPLTLNRAAILRTWSSVSARSPLRIIDAADSETAASADGSSLLTSASGRIAMHVPRPSIRSVP
jgi:RNA polymerase sigma factor (sigma-70 family)